MTLEQNQKQISSFSIPTKLTSSVGVSKHAIRGQQIKKTKLISSCHFFHHVSVLQKMNPAEGAVNYRCQNYLEKCFSELAAEIQCQTDLSTKFLCESKSPSELCW